MFLKDSEIMPKFTRLAAWMRSTDLAMIALTPRYIGQSAACSVELPGPWDSPATTTVCKPFFLAAIALLGNAGSMGSKTNSEYLGTLDLYLSLAPAGIMWSVVILSPTLIPTLPFMLSGILSLTGGVPMFGPLTISTLLSASFGKMNMESSMRNLVGMLTCGYSMSAF